LFPPAALPAKTPIRRSLICDMTRPISLSKRIHDDMRYFIGFLGRLHRLPREFFADVRLGRRVSRHQDLHLDR
jgi:hypothetical protein